jgi:hypothetical protein
MSSTLSNVVVTAKLSGTLASSLFSTALLHQPTRIRPAIGTNSGQINIVYAGTFSLASAAPLDLDLKTLTDPAGNSVAFSHENILLIENLSGAAFTMGGATSNAFIAAIPLPVKPGGFHLFADPTAGDVVDATHKVLRFVTASGTASGQLTIYGRNA